MECARCKELLSDYIDGILDARTNKLLEEHLLVCKGCREDLDSLRALVQEMGSLESLEAPGDFLEKVHERIEQRSKLGQILRKLFVPVRIKVPLELATVTVMAILILAVVNFQQPIKQEIAHSPLDSDRLICAKKAKVDAVQPTPKMEAYKPIPSFEKTTAELSETESKIIELVLLAKTESFSSAYAPSAAKGLAQTSRKRTGTIDEERMDVSSYAETGISRQAVSTAETKSREVKQEKRADDTLLKVRGLIERVDGKIISIEYEKQTEQPQSIHLEIPTKHYNSFCDGLRDIALLQTTPSPISEKDQKVIQILIRLIH